ncbi:5'-3' exonuclease [Deinococcus hopiensis]|uniref:5'-3' exonuclease n=1 Tax=Deinococcus hopiensis KR-140 TaxID=695939 RepID=A0A1W1UTV1_9DEIO|nr:5'-3' exonuclease H3TH domain-containing protein [Deinococcus hopiensis]SMB84565.1 5'-3' exonuclease [Deinococcus hopiensis KR-140]
MTAPDLLLDASNLIVRAYFATGGVHPQNVLRDRLREYQHVFGPRHVIAALDSPSNFRKRLEPTYKGQRGSKPPELEALLRRGAELMGALGCICAAAPDHEADDVMATLAERAPGNVVIVTTDADLHACVRDEVQVYSPGTRKRFTQMDYEAKYGFPRERFALYKALCGCESDNIPGVRNVGPARAQKVVARCGTVEGVYSELGSFDRTTQAGLQETTPEAIHAAMQLTRLVSTAPVRRISTATAGSSGAPRKPRGEE